MREIIITSILKGFDPKTAFFEGWFKFNNLGLALGMALKFYTSAAKGLKLKVRKFWGLIPSFAEVTAKKLALNKVKNRINVGYKLIIYEKRWN